jgi:hypothetical protein
VTTMWVGAFCRWQKCMSGLATCTLYLHGRLREPRTSPPHAPTRFLVPSRARVDAGGYLQCTVKGPASDLLPHCMGITAARESGPQMSWTHVAK